MTTVEYARYVIDNINRASMANTLNIVKSLCGEKATYDPKEFLESVIKVLGDIVVFGNLGTKKTYEIVVLAQKALDSLESDKHKLQMVIDEFILKLWKIRQ